MTSAHRHVRGYTLAEVVVFSALLLMFIYALYGVLVAEMRYQHIADAEVAAKQNGMQSMKDVVQYLSESRYKSVVWDTSTATPMLIFPTPRDANGVFHYDPATTALLWQRWLAVYVVNADVPTLVMQSQAITPPATAPGAAPSAASFEAVSGAQQRVLGFGVANFVATKNPALGGWQLDMTFKQSEVGQDDTFQFETSIYPIN
jgi:hypothetical protein